MAKAITAETHKNIVYVEKDGRVCYQKERKLGKAEETAEEPYTVTLEEILDFSEHAVFKELEFFKRSHADQPGDSPGRHQHKYGLQVGKISWTAQKTDLWDRTLPIMQQL